MNHHLIRQNHYSRATIAGIVFAACLLLVSCGESDDSDANQGDIESSLTNSADYLQKGQFQAAIIESRNAMQAGPGDERGPVSLAKIYLELGQPRAATRLLEQFEGTSPGYVLALAEAYSKTGKYRSASETLGKAQLPDHQKEANLILAQIAMARGEFDNAGKIYNALLEEDATDLDAQFGLATISGANGDFDKAEAQLNDILKVEPTHARALLVASSLQTRKGDLARAEELLMEAVSAMPNSDNITPLRYTILATLRDNLTSQGKSSEALIYSGLLAESMPGSEEVAELFEQVNIAVQGSDFDEARRLLAEIQVLAPGSERAGTMLGVIDYLQGDNAAAVKQFEQALDPEIASPTALQLYAMAELKLNQPEKVLALLKADIEASQDAKLVALYGIAAASSGDDENGQKYLLRALALDPENGRLRLPLVQLLNRQGNPEAALLQIRQAFEASPGDPVIQTAMVQQLAAVGQKDRVAEVVRGIRSGYPKSQESQLLVASYYLTEQNRDEAYIVLQDVLALGESRRARMQIAGIYLTRQAYAEALSEYRRLIEVNPEDGDAYKGLFTVYELQKKVPEALEEIRKLATENNAVAPLLVMSEYHGRASEFDTAFKLLEGLDEKRPEVQTLATAIYIAKADQQFRQQLYDDGRQTALAALAITPENPRLLALLTSIEIGAGRLEEAGKIHGQLATLVDDAPITYILAGDLASAKNDPTTAVEQYRLAWKALPSDQLATKLYAALRSVEGSSDASQVAFLKEWKEKIGTSTLSNLVLAGHQMESGNLSAARAGYESLLAGGQNSAVAHNNLAWIYGEAEIDKAVAAGRRAYELAPESAEIIDTYGWFSYKKGELARARELLAKAVSLAPENQEIRAHYEEVSSQ